MAAVRRGPHHGGFRRRHAAIARLVDVNGMLTATVPLATEVDMTTLASFEAVYRTEFARLVGAPTLYCGDRDLAGELVQEAMARACHDGTQVVVEDPSAERNTGLAAVSRDGSSVRVLTGTQADQHPAYAPR
jgi:hypothetical protein